MNKFRYLIIKIKDWFKIQKRLRTLRRMRKNLDELKRRNERCY